MLAGFAAFGSLGFGRSLAGLLWISVILCAAVGVVRRDPLFRTSLNHWDEAAAFGALFALVHVVNDMN